MHRCTNTTGCRWLERHNRQTGSCSALVSCSTFLLLSNSCWTGSCSALVSCSNFNLSFTLQQLLDLILSVISGRYHTARLWFANILSIKIILISTGTARPTSVNQTFVPQQYPNTKEPPPTNLYYSLLGPIHNCLEKNLRSANCKDQLMSCCWSIARFSTIQYNVLYNLATWQKSDFLPGFIVLTEK